MNCNIYEILNSIGGNESNFSEIFYVSRQATCLNLSVNKIEALPYDKIVCKNLFSDLFNEEKVNFILVDEICIKEIYNILTEVNNDILFENKSVKDAILTLFRNKNLPLPNNVEEYYNLPSKCRAIINPNGLNQGLYFKQSGSYNFFLPKNLDDLKTMFTDAILPFLNELNLNMFNTYTFKTFGISKNDIKNILSLEIKNKDKVSIKIFEDNLDCAVCLQAKKDNNLLEKYVNLVFEKLNSFVYANEDITLYKMAFDLLKINNLKIAFAESITGGNVVAQFIQNNEGSSNFVLEGQVTYTNQAKTNRLNVSDKILDAYTDVSPETTYEMAVGLLNTTKANIVLSTTGYASPNKKGTGGLVYISVGDKKSIDVYKNTFKGDRKTVVELATKAAYFYLIKKLKKNDFYLEKETI